jgi:uncharacterized membrane protein
MQGAATFLHHPIHPMLVAFPIAFFLGSLGADALFLGSRKEFWRKCALALIGFGILGGLAAAVAGLVDFKTAPMTGAAFDAATDHRNINFALLALFAANFALRWRKPGHWFGYLLTLAGCAMVLYSGWLGGELVFRHEVGVALADAPWAGGTVALPAP